MSFWEGDQSSADDGFDDDGRQLRSFSGNLWTNFTVDSEDGDDFTSKLVPVSDVSVDAVLTSIYLNAVAFIILMASYECLRRLLPAVYSSQIKRQFKAGVRDQEEDSSDNLPQHTDSVREHHRTASLGSLDASLPDVISFNWVASVFGVPWATVRKYSGLDAYFFLRFIRMNLRICAVTTFWAFLILVPLYATGVNQNGEEGWYHLSVANVTKGSWRMWIPSVFAYFFSGFIFFVMKQEYRHFLELRMNFLARGSSYVDPQHHYSLLVENIPQELRSDKALFDYFNKLFPGKVHSASVVLNLPDLEAVKARCLRVCRRLEKSIAYLHATGERPSHKVGTPRVQILGIDLAPCDYSCSSLSTPTFVNEQSLDGRPERGTHVDSISYYTYDLAQCNHDMYFMQQRKTEMAFQGNPSDKADSWLSRLMITATEVADQIMLDSAEDNFLRANYAPYDEYENSIPQAELMSSRYGSFGNVFGLSPRTAQCGPVGRKSLQRNEPTIEEEEFAQTSLSERARGSARPDAGDVASKRSPSQEKLLEKQERKLQARYGLPGQTQHSTFCRRLFGRLGLDFVVAGVQFANRQIDHAMEGVAGSTMSSTGFVTFLDLTSVTSAACTPLTSKPQLLNVSVAPEPRDIIWANAHVSAKTRARNERMANFFLFIGVFFWIFPLAAIQAFAKADYIARIPGMEWILTSGNGSVSRFVNGYLPVVALLCLILILPVIFEVVARKYERRMTISDVHRSMLSRYFYYQVVNIYISVTAGSLWRSLADILDHPSNLLELLGESLPSMVGYFVALLVTKILAGLPVVFLRVGALSRMLLLRSLSSGAKLTQRELDRIYRPENVQYGWEFPSQLLVIVIVFTYAIICPVILPVGLLYFCGSLIVYKKQVLYVYQPVYESGGAMFPSALQRTLFALVCGQMTLIGYLVTRGFYWQPTFLLPLPIATIWGMGYFDTHYATPSTRLSLERAREYDRISEILAAKGVSSRHVAAAASRDDGDGGGGVATTTTASSSPTTPTRSEFGFEGRKSYFDKNSYRQPVLTEKAMKPRFYRRGQIDPLTEDCRRNLRQLEDYSLMNETTETL